MNIPTLSVITPNYNHAQHLARALEAILNQSYQPLEVIVVDDCSMDNSLPVIEQFMKRSQTIRLLRNERNMGIIYSANRAADQARGDYLYFACADDIILPGFFERSMNMLREYPQAGLSCSDPVYFIESFNIRHKQAMRISGQPRYFHPEEVVKLMRNKRSDIIAPLTVIIKRSAWLEAGGLIPELEWHSDWLPYFAAASRYGFCYLPQFLSMKRMVTGSYSCRKKRFREAERALKNVIRVLDSPAFDDVRPIFKRTGVLSRFGPHMLKVLISDPKHWHYITILLIFRILRLRVVRALSWIVLLFKRTSNFVIKWVNKKY